MFGKEVKVIWQFDRHKLNKVHVYSRMEVSKVKDIDEAVYQRQVQVRKHKVLRTAERIPSRSYLFLTLGLKRSEITSSEDTTKLSVT